MNGLLLVIFGLSTVLSLPSPVVQASCPKNSESIGLSIGGICPSGASLVGTTCCLAPPSCPSGYTVLGAALGDGVCPAGAKHIDGSCCLAN